MGVFTHFDRRLLQVLLRSSFLPLIACTLLCFGVLAVRMRLTHSINYAFLVWNLFLAWIPYWLATIAAAIDRPTQRRWSRLALAAIWLAFLPNCPYILTDIGHVIVNPQWAWWYDAGMILLFAWTGCFLGAASLREMHSIVQNRRGWLLGWLFVLIVCGLCGFGVYLGRFERWNSWDLLLHPMQIVLDAVSRVGDPGSHLRTWGVTAMVSTLFLASYLAVYRNHAIQRLVQQLQSFPTDRNDPGKPLSVP